jgi:hypothetical protein
MHAVFKTTGAKCTNNNKLAPGDTNNAGGCMKSTATVTVSDALGRAERNLGKGQSSHMARVAEELAGLEPAQLRVLESKQRLAEYGRRPGYREQGSPTAGEPTTERLRHSPDGADRRDLISGQVIDKSAPASKYPSPARAEIRPPMTMTIQSMEEMHQALKEGKVAVPRAGCILDKSLTQTQRGALEDLVLDADVIERSEIRISQYGEQSMPRFSSVRRGLAFARVSFLYKVSPAAFHVDIEDFIAHMLGIPKENMRTFQEIGYAITGSSDQRVQKGGYMGRMSGIADVVNEAYLAFDIAQRRQKAGLASMNAYSYKAQAVQFFEEMRQLTHGGER